MRKNSCFLFLLLWISSCGKGEFIPDPIDPRIPSYTEKGYDAAGALINGQVWRAVRIPAFYTSPARQELRLKLHEDTTKLYVEIDGNVVNDTKDDIRIEFVLDNTENFQRDFFALGGTKFNLDGNPHYAHLTLGSSKAYCHSKDGQLFIKHAARKLDTSTGKYVYILSGTFGFTIESEECHRVEVLYGRFDYSVAWPPLRF